jgi:nucleoside 2-deoxyribosyltransferase
MKRVYCAGPISGKNLGEMYRAFTKRAEVLQGMGFEVLHPFLGMDELNIDEVAKAKGYEDPIACDRAIFGRDRWMIKQADILFADLTNAKTKVSIGTTMELAWGYEREEVLVIVAGLNTGDAMDHAFVHEAADLVFPTYENALAFLKHLKVT